LLASGRVRDPAEQLLKLLRASVCQSVCMENSRADKLILMKFDAGDFYELSGIHFSFHLDKKQITATLDNSINTF
jgi:hypothetical protein